MRAGGIMPVRFPIFELGNGIGDIQGSLDAGELTELFIELMKYMKKY